MKYFIIHIIIYSMFLLELKHTCTSAESSTHSYTN